MKYKFSIILSLLVLLPLLLLVWMGLQLFNNEKVVQQHQSQQLVNSQLREADQFILGYFTELENALLKTPSFIDSSIANVSGNENFNVNFIRQHIRKSPYIENVFILNPAGKLLFPQQKNASRKEQNFINKTAELWSTMEAFRPDTPADIGSEKQRRISTEKNDNSQFSVSGALSQLNRKTQQSSYKSKSSSAPVSEEIASSADINSDIASSGINDNDRISTVKAKLVKKLQKQINTGNGWTVWRTGTETQVFFWFWNSNNQLTGLKLAGAYWLAELINRLPDDRNATDYIGDARIQLINEKQTVIYQWGQFEQSLVENLQPKGQRLLGHPLDGWRLAYFSSNNNNNNNLQLLLYLTLIFAVSIILASLGFYMYREYRRDMRLAEQRVTFVNQVSHELKTPLTNICLYAELIESEAEDSDDNACGGDNDGTNHSKIHRYSKVLTTESQRLGRLINNVLRFSQSQKKEHRLERQIGQIDDTIHAAVDMFRPAFETKNIHIELTLNAKNTVMFDQHALEQIINNLLGNIEKYAHRGEYAHIESSQIENKTHIRIQDHGPGIDKKLAKRIFEPFFRGNSKITEGVSGTGIGLSIAKELCQLHNGDLQIEQNTQKGARFVITLNTPLAEIKK